MVERVKIESFARKLASHLKRVSPRPTGQDRRLLLPTILARPPAPCQAKVTKRNIRTTDEIIRNIRTVDTIS